MPKTAQIAALIVIAIIKAALVVLFYMHLRYDSKGYMLILLAGIFFALLLGRFLPLIVEVRPPASTPAPLPASVGRGVMVRPGKEVRLKARPSS